MERGLPSEAAHRMPPESIKLERKPIYHFNSNSGKWIINTAAII